MEGAPASDRARGAGETDLRVATLDDLDDIVALAAAALGWAPGAPHRELFEWKHLRNPFGPSPMWVAVSAGRIVAFRALLPWVFADRGHGTQRAVRAVDTATHPDARGQGLFTRLTSLAVDEMLFDGVDFVFNTPNAQSRPGYLKMGWHPVGRVPVGVRVSRARSLPKVAGARVPAGKWSLDTAAGEDASAVLEDEPALRALLAGQPEPERLTTARTATFLRWRYGDGPVRYRAVLRTGRVEDGVALFRLRARGRAVEATVCDVIVPDDDRRLRADLLDRVRRYTAADYVIHVQSRPVARASVRVPRLGPLLTYRPLNRADTPPLSAWDLRLGDIELL